jgi:hypothetical protein
MSLSFLHAVRVLFIALSISISHTSIEVLSERHCTTNTLDDSGRYNNRQSQVAQLYVPSRNKLLIALGCFERVVPIGVVEILWQAYQVLVWPLFIGQKKSRDNSASAKHCHGVTSVAREGESIGVPSELERAGKKQENERNGLVIDEREYVALAQFQIVK